MGGRFEICLISEESQMTSYLKFNACDDFSVETRKMFQQHRFVSSWNMFLKVSEFPPWEHETSLELVTDLPSKLGVSVGDRVVGNISLKESGAARSAEEWMTLLSEPLKSAHAAQIVAGFLSST